jgi:hypothetical protein
MIPPFPRDRGMGRVVYRSIRDHQENVVGKTEHKVEVSGAQVVDRRLPPELGR